MKYLVIIYKRCLRGDKKARILKGRTRSKRSTPSIKPIPLEPFRLTGSCPLMSWQRMIPTGIR